MRAKQLAALVVGLMGFTPAVGFAQTQGTFQWAGIGNSFVSSFLYDDQGTTLSAYAGGAYNAQFQIASTDPHLPPHAQTGFGPVVDIYCVDFLHDANTGSYNAWFTNLGSDALTKTRTNDLVHYLKAAYLVHKLEITTSQADLVDIHAAIWNIMAGEPYAAKVGWVDEGFDADAHNRMLGWVTQANANYRQVDGDAWTVVTDACVAPHAGLGSAAADGCSQEFVTRSPVVTPEPATIVLLATGMLLMGGLAFATRASLIV